MEVDTPMILPKGIVVNTKHIYDEVASYRTVPPDRVWDFWRVYTTTTKELQDPTARRLENFWWHVLGSDRRLLRGEVLAKLYENISLGPTFVPLRGPPNRWEGDFAPYIQQALEILQNEQEAANPHIKSALNENASRSSKELSSSAAKPPPHPILKKPSGPSSTGPRPTARFISPHASDDGRDKDGETPSSGSTVTPALEMRMPVTSPPKKKVAGKRFVASTAAAKRRPALPRKTSSQPGTPDQGSRGSTSSSSSRGPEAPKQPASPVSEATTRDIAPNSDEANAADSQERPTLSAKAAGKRPMLATRPTVEGKESKPNPELDNRSPASTEASPAPSTTRPQSLSNLSAHSRATAASPRPATNCASSRRTSDAQKLVGPLPMAKSRSHSGEFPRSESRTPARPRQGLFTGATASTTNVAAQGMIIDQGGSVNSVPTSEFFDHVQDHRGSASGPLSSSVLDLQFTPTPPSTSASVPLGRTKSQLTLLLERENEARTGNKPR